MSVAGPHDRLTCARLGNEALRQMRAVRADLLAFVVLIDRMEVLLLAPHVASATCVHLPRGLLRVLHSRV